MTHAIIQPFTSKGPHFIGIRGGDYHVRVSDYVNGIRKAKENPDMTFSHGLGGWWPETGREILTAFRRHLDTVINRKAGLTIPETCDRYAALARRIRRGRLVRKCAWCGGAFVPKTVHDRFDAPDCARAYNI